MCRAVCPSPVGLTVSLGAWAAVPRQGPVSLGPLLLMRYSVACDIYVPGHGPLAGQVRALGTQGPWAAAPHQSLVRETFRCVASWTPVSSRAASLPCVA